MTVMERIFFSKKKKKKNVNTAEANHNYLFTYQYVHARACLTYVHMYLGGVPMYVEYLPFLLLQYVPTADS